MPFHILYFLIYRSKYQKNSKSLVESQSEEYGNVMLHIENRLNMSHSTKLRKSKHSLLIRFSSLYRIITNFAWQ